MKLNAMPQELHVLRMQTLPELLAHFMRTQRTNATHMSSTRPDLCRVHG